MSELKIGAVFRNIETGQLYKIYSEGVSPNLVKGEYIDQDSWFINTISDGKVINIGGMSKEKLERNINNIEIINYVKLEPLWSLSIETFKNCFPLIITKPDNYIKAIILSMEDYKQFYSLISKYGNELTYSILEEFGYNVTYKTQFE